MSEKVNFMTNDQIDMGQKLGEGSFGVVYKGRWKERDVAIKRLKMTELSKDVFRDFLAEAKVMMSLRNPVVTQLLGIIKESPYGLVLEFLPGGNLKELLHSKQQLEWPRQWQIASDIAAGLRYLHKSNKLHRDLKSENVLLDGDLRAKITDFGLVKTKETSRATFTHNSGLVGSGTLAWMAPEQMTRKAKLTAKVDVYAFGIILWEIAARKHPLEGVTALTDLIVKVRTGQRDPMPENCPKPFADLHQKCIEVYPVDRPTSAEAYEMIQHNVKVPHNHDFEYELLKADKGSAIAQYNAACRYFSGNGTPKDKKKAVEYFQKSAFQGDEDAAYKLGQCFEKGIGVDKNLEQAVKFYGLSASTGHADSHYRLGQVFMEGIKPYSVNPSRAIMHFETAARNGSARAQYALGLRYLKGTGVKQDQEKAVNYFKQAAKQGVEQAKKQLEELKL